MIIFFLTYNLLHILTLYFKLIFNVCDFWVSMKHSMPLIERYKHVIISILKPKGNFEHSHQTNTVVDWVSVQDCKNS